MSEEQAQQLMYQMQMLENYFVELSHKEESVINIIREASSAIQSIRSISDKPESSALVPIGMGSFVKAKLSSDDKFILNLGAGAAIEKDKDSAINYIESRIKEMEVALSDIVAQKQQVMANLEQGKQEVNRLIQAAQKQ
ncbi:MAG TPA: prefoldin subunit alpha [Nitrosopumilaceae archaeon]|jgi:prefoldin alpha subunit